MILKTVVTCYSMLYLADITLITSQLSHSFLKRYREEVDLGEGRWQVGLGSVEKGESAVGI